MSVARRTQDALELKRRNAPAAARCVEFPLLGPATRHAMINASSAQRQSTTRSMHHATAPIASPSTLTATSTSSRRHSSRAASRLQRQSLTNTSARRVIKRTAALKRDLRCKPPFFAELELARLGAKFFLEKPVFVFDRRRAFSLQGLTRGREGGAGPTTSSASRCMSRTCSSTAMRPCTALAESLTCASSAALVAERRKTGVRKVSGLPSELRVTRDKSRTYGMRRVGTIELMLVWQRVLKTTSLLMLMLLL